MSVLSIRNGFPGQAFQLQGLPALTAPQVSMVRELLQALDAYEGGGLGGGSPMQQLLEPPQGYLRGATAQMMAQAAGFLQGLQAAQMMDVSIGSRMLLSLGLFQSQALGTMGMGMGVGVGTMGMSISAYSNRTNDQPEKDRFAVHESCRTGADNPSNLNNSPHVKLALYNILKDNHDNMPPEQLKKELEDRYGIKADITTVKGNDGRELKALKFENGDMLVDGSGNGSFGNADYNLKGAVKDLQEKYGITPEDFEKNAQELKKAGTSVGEHMGAGYGGQYRDQVNFFQAQFASVMPFQQYQGFFPMQEISAVFAQAFMLADQ